MFVLFAADRQKTTVLQKIGENMRVSDYIVKRLVQAGVKHVFMVTGRGLLYLSDALAANKEIKAVSTHHEQGAGFAAYAYAESQNGLGACFVSTGCASTNAITAVMCAWQDDVPLVVVSGQNKLKETTYHTHSLIRSYGQQENDIVSLVAPITKYATMVEKASDIGYIMDKAIYEAQSGRKGPVWIDVPLDIQSSRVEEAELTRFTPERTEKDTIDVSAVIGMLSDSERPVLLIGSGVKGASGKVKRLVETLHVPLTYDASAVDVYTNENALSIGCVGSMSGTRAGNFTVQNSDLLIAIGCRISTMLTGEEREKFAREAKMIVVDTDEHELKENCFREMSTYHCDPVTFIDALLDSCKIDNTRDQWVEKCLHWKKVFPKNIYKDHELPEKLDMYEVAELLGECAGGGTTFITDAGIEELVFPAALCVKQGSRVIHPVSQGAMGFAIPAVMGAHFAAGGPVVCVVGDGSIMMNLQELQTISANRIPVKIVIINNNCYAVIRSRQKELFRNRTIGTDPSDGVTLPDYAKVADCFGFDYFRVDGREHMNVLVDAVNSSAACICEIMCREDQQFLRNSYYMDEKHRPHRRSLEDQAPFLERDVIRSEMVIKPIEMG